MSDELLAAALPKVPLTPAVVDLAILASEDHRVLSICDPGSGIWILAHFRMAAFGMPGHE